MSIWPRTLSDERFKHSMPCDWYATGHEVSALASFENLMRIFMHSRSIPSGALAVAKNKKLVFARGYTAAGGDKLTEPNSLFRIASISKPLTATAVMRLVQDYQLDISEKLTDVLKFDHQLAEVLDQRLHKVTIRHLLQHLGGWNRNKTFDPMFYDISIANALDVGLPISRSNIYSYMSGQSLQHAPGTTYSYSNFGYSLLGEIIAKITNQSYEKYIKQAVLSPMGITQPKLARSLPRDQQPNEVDYYSQYKRRSVHNNSNEKVPAPYAWNIENMDSHGGWLTSAVDLVRFAVNFDDFKKNPVLNSQILQSMFALPENIDSTNYKAGDAYYGCGWKVRDYAEGKRNIWHGGSLPGTFSLLVNRWSGDLSWCVLFNQRDDPSKLSYAEIDRLLHHAANAVEKWPTHDFFDEYLKTPS